MNGNNSAVKIAIDFAKGTFVLMLTVIMSAFLFNLNSEAQTAKTIKLVLSKGQRFEVTTVARITSTSTVMGQEMESRTDTTTVQTIDVIETRPGETDLAVTTNEIAANSQAMGQEMSYDSKKKDNSGPLADAFNKILGQTKKLTINSAGKAVKREQEEKSAGDSSIVAGLGSSDLTLFRPSIIGRTLTVNDTWPDLVAIKKEGIESNTSGTYLVKSIDNNLANIIFEAVQKTSGAMEQMGQEMSLTGSNKFKDVIKMNINTGLIIESTSEMDGSFAVETSGMNIPAVVKSTTTIRVKPIVP
jgi:hypothetical protein